MRKANVLVCVSIFAIFTYLLHLCSTLISLLYTSAGDNAIPSSAIPPISEHHQIGNSSILIPKIIHQTYIDDNIPEIWQAGQEKCISLHSDYEYILWTDKKSREFIATHYAWFLPTFDTYAHPIQRADTIRYFVLSHYGGIYIDLDDGCNRRLDPLLDYPFFARMTTPTGISNDVLGSAPNHPFLNYIIQHLQQYDRNWWLPYITVMYSTGPLFVSCMWSEWLSQVVSESDRVRILMPEQYSKGAESFFNIAKGDSWHQEDADLMFWMKRHWIALVILGASIVGIFGYGLFRMMSRDRRSTSRSGPQDAIGMKRLGKWWRGSSETDRGRYQEVSHIA